jgi:hypothetical protein
VEGEPVSELRHFVALATLRLLEQLVATPLPGPLTQTAIALFAEAGAAEAFAAASAAPAPAPAPAPLPASLTQLAEGSWLIAIRGLGAAVAHQCATPGEIAAEAAAALQGRLSEAPATAWARVLSPGTAGRLPALPPPPPGLIGIPGPDEAVALARAAPQERAAVIGAIQRLVTAPPALVLREGGEGEGEGEGESALHSLALPLRATTWPAVFEDALLPLHDIALVAAIGGPATRGAAEAAKAAAALLASGPRAIAELRRRFCESAAPAAPAIVATGGSAPRGGDAASGGPASSSSLSSLAAALRAAVDADVVPRDGETPRALGEAGNGANASSLSPLPALAPASALAASAMPSASLPPLVLRLGGCETAVATASLLCRALLSASATAIRSPVFAPLWIRCLGSLLAQHAAVSSSAAASAAPRAAAGSGGSASALGLPLAAAVGAAAAAAAAALASAVSGSREPASEAASARALLLDALEDGLRKLFLVLAAPLHEGTRAHAGAGGGANSEAEAALSSAAAEGVVPIGDGLGSAPHSPPRERTRGGGFRSGPARSPTGAEVANSGLAPSPTRFRTMLHIAGDATGAAVSEAGSEAGGAALWRQTWLLVDAAAAPALAAELRELVSSMGAVPAPCVDEVLAEAPPKAPATGAAVSGVGAAPAPAAAAPAPAVSERTTAPAPVVATVPEGVKSATEVLVASAPPAASAAAPAAVPAALVPAPSAATDAAVPAPASTEAATSVAAAEVSDEAATSSHVEPVASHAPAQPAAAAPVVPPPPPAPPAATAAPSTPAPPAAAAAQPVMAPAATAPIGGRGIFGSLFRAFMGDIEAEDEEEGEEDATPVEGEAVAAGAE